MCVCVCVCVLQDFMKDFLVRLENDVQGATPPRGYGGMLPQKIIETYVHALRLP